MESLIQKLILVMKLFKAIVNYSIQFSELIHKLLWVYEVFNQAFNQFTIQSFKNPKIIDKKNKKVSRKADWGKDYGKSWIAMGLVASGEVLGQWR